MKKIIFLLTLMFVFWPQKTYANETIEEIKTMCAEKWQSDFRMQKYCRDRQFKAIQKLGEFQKKHINKYGTTSFTQEMINKDPYLQIFLNCEEKWTKGHKTDYRMIDYCTEKQVEAFKTLQ